VRSRLSQLHFKYTPKPGFDARKVKGLVASLLALKPENHEKSTAFEFATSGKLYNVVVEDERVGKGLLKRGGVKNCVTLIPLNKIRAFAEVRTVVPVYFRPPTIMCQTLLTETTKRQAARPRQSAACDIARRLPR
jgi:hypothetical protein